MIIVNPGKINDYIHLIDLHHFGLDRVCSCYIAEFDDCSIILDCGSSIDVKNLIKYMKKNNISFESIKYIAVSHHHFDHIGGISKVYEEVKKFNPYVKIICDVEIKDLIINYEDHFNRAKKAYGWIAGKMKPIEGSAFEIIEASDFSNMDISDLEPFDTFTKGGEKIDFIIINTPGHCSDHKCFLFIRNEEVDFAYIVEALGTFGNSSKLVTWPSSMPPNFKYIDYMQTVKNLKKLKIKRLGFAHFGVIDGRDDVKMIVDDHEDFMKEFRNKIIEYHQENPETKYIFDKIIPLLVERTDRGEYIKNPVLAKLPLGVVYGMMVDLGYR
jgi:glyoxylase-like metal-dependent hydrolase (beta-lactamase superfamily II)